MHVRYLERSGVGIDGGKPRLFGPDQAAEVDTGRTISEWKADRHHFRFVVSPENAAWLDLERYARSVVDKMQRSIGMKLEWFAVVHHNTDNPHFHLVVRGKTPDGNDLYIDKDYIQNGLRFDAQEVATQQLGRRSERERSSDITQSITAERVTAIDRSLIAEAKNSKDGLIRVSLPGVTMRASAVRYRLDRTARLEHLRKLGMAEELTTGTWRIVPDIRERLHRLQHRNDVERLVRRHTERSHPEAPLIILDPSTELPAPVFGKVVGRAESESHLGRRFALVQGAVGDIYCIPVSRHSEPEGFETKPGTLVTIRQTKRGKIDQVIASHSPDGTLSLTALRSHLEREDNSASRMVPGGDIGLYIESIRKRCASLQRVGILKELDADRWLVPRDLKDRVTEFEKSLRNVPRRYFRLDSESPLPLEKQTKWIGPTWLDKLIHEPRKLAAIPPGILKEEIENATRERTLFLENRGIPVGRGRQTLAVLESREREAAIKRYSQRHGSMAPIESGSSTGRVEDYTVIADRRHAVLSTDSGWHLVPLHPFQSRLETGSYVSIGTGDVRRGLSLSLVRSPERGRSR